MNFFFSSSSSYRWWCRLTRPQHVWLMSVVYLFFTPSSSICVDLEHRRVSLLIIFLKMDGDRPSVLTLTNWRLHVFLIQYFFSYTDLFVCVVVWRRPFVFDECCQFESTVPHDVNNKRLRASVGVRAHAVWFSMCVFFFDIDNTIEDGPPSLNELAWKSTKTDPFIETINSADAAETGALSRSPHCGSDLLTLSLNFFGQNKEET